MTEDLRDKEGQSVETQAGEDTAERVKLPEDWQSEVNLSMNAARCHLEQKSRGTGKLSLGAIAVKRRGRLITCTFNKDEESSDEIAQQILPGTRVTLMGRKYVEPEKKPEEETAAAETTEEGKRKCKTGILKAELKSIKEDENRNPLATFMLIEKGSLPTEDLDLGGEENVEREDSESDSFTVLYKYKRGNDEKRLALINECEERKLTEPGKVFLSGKFKKPDEARLEKREDLDEAQNKAFGMAMAYEACPVLFIHGGPGTGKTRTICTIVEEHVKRERKVLVLSHSNKGTDVPAVMIKERIKKGETEQIPIFRAGNDPQIVDQKLHTDRIKRKIKFPSKELRHVKEKIEQDAENTYAEELARRKKVSLEKFLETEGYESVNAFFAANPDMADTAMSFYLQKQGVKSLKDMEDLERDFIIRKYHDQVERRGVHYRKAIERGGATFSTLGGLLNDEILEETDFDVVIVDESTRLHDHDMLLALKKAGKQIIFVGDPLQLGNIPLMPQEKTAIIDAMTIESDWNLTNYTGENGADATIQNTRKAIEALMTTRAKIGSSPDWIREVHRAVELFGLGSFSRAILHSKDPERDLTYVFLNKDRRSREKIVRILSNLKYDGKLLPGRESAEGEHEGIVEFIDTKTVEAREHAVGTSKRNPKEAEIIADMVLARVMHKDHDKRVPPEKIAVIATYAEQATAIKRLIRKKLWNNRGLQERLSRNIASVDAFQGDERSVVYVSMTRSNTEGDIGFLEEQRRIGVAIGRAQDELYIVGDMKTLTERNRDPESRQFFEAMKGQVAEHGKIKRAKYTPYKRRGGHRRGGRKNRQERQEHAAA